jgi:hypothetical protein
MSDIDDLVEDVIAAASLITQPTMTGTRILAALR